MGVVQLRLRLSGWTRVGTKEWRTEQMVPWLAFINCIGLTCWEKVGFDGNDSEIEWGFLRNLWWCGYFLLQRTRVLHWLEVEWIGRTAKATSKRRLRYFKEMGDLQFKVWKLSVTSLLIHLTDDRDCSVSGWVSFGFELPCLCNYLSCLDSSSDRYYLIAENLPQLSSSAHIFRAIFFSFF